MLLILELLFFVIAIYYLGKGFYKKNSAEVSSLSIKNYQYTATVWFLVFGLIGFYLIDYFIVGVLAKNLILIGYFGLVVFILQKRVFSTNFKPEESFFKVAKGFLILSSCLAILIVGLILASLVFESYHFFTKVNIFDFLFGTKWNPVEEHDALDGLKNYYGFLPVLGGTLLITLIALVIASFLGIFAAIYIAEYLPKKTRSRIKPVLEILAGIPSVVYGFFAVVVISPFVVLLGEKLGFNIEPEAAIIAGVVIGLQITPLVLSLSDDAIFAVPNSLRDGSTALGATKAETVIRVILPSSLNGIIASLILAFSRAIGETMIVVMAAGRFANLSLNPFEAVSTATVQIVMLLTGDQEFSSVKTLSAFALGISLFFITLSLNFLALRLAKGFGVKN
jgi:phosphate transport system permease protein